MKSNFVRFEIDISRTITKNFRSRGWLLSCLLASVFLSWSALLRSVTVVSQQRMLLVSSAKHNINIDIALSTNSFQSQHFPVTKSAYAYAYVIGGCNPAYPTYKHYIYNILISTKILREKGSQADFVVFIQMVWAANRTTLPSDDEQLLRDYDIRIRYLPTTPKESFYRTMFDKFRILGLTEYDRVLFMDGDIIPTTNLDYLLQLSRDGTLRENVVVQGSREPANGGFFLLQPGKLKEINEIIQQREREASQMKFPYFNFTSGWGHTFQPPEDGWEGNLLFGTDWDFHGGFADQGLLYYWVKYVEKDVSICMQNGTIQHWFVDGNGSLVTFSEFDPLAKYSKNKERWRSWQTYPPIRDFHHFTGDRKPWMRGPPQDLSKETSLSSPLHYWFWQLGQLNHELQIGLNFTAWQTGQKPELGFYPKYKSILNASLNLLESV